MAIHRLGMALVHVSRLMKKRGEDTELLLEDYDDLKKTSSLSSSFDARPHIFNIANCIVGVSVLAMPYCFQQCGILLAVGMIAMCSVITKYTCHFLFVGATNVRVKGYEALAAAALGHRGRKTIEMLLLLFLMSSIVAYIVVIGDLGPHIVADFLELAAPTERLRVLVMVVVMFFVIIPLSTIKDLELFSVVSSVAVVFYVVFLFRIIFESFEALAEGSWSMHVVWWRPEGFLSCLPIVGMALACQTQLFHIADCIPHVTVDQMDYLVSSAVNLCSAMYAGVGLFGYVAFYSRTLHGDVLVQLAPTFFTQLLKLAFMLSVAVSVPLMLFPARHALFNLCLRPNGCELPMARIHRSTFHILSAIILLFNLLIAILIPNVEFVLGLTGSLIGSLVTMILPSLLFIRVAKSSEINMIRVAKVCFVVGLSILVLCTYVTLSKEQKSNLAARPEPKEKVEELPEAKAIENLEKLEGQVLDANLNISQRLNDVSQLAAEGKENEAKQVIEEIKQQQEEQRELIQKQEKIVDQLNKHMEEHDRKKSEEKGGEEEKKMTTTTTTIAPKVDKDTVVKDTVVRDTVDKKELEKEEKLKEVVVVVEERRNESAVKPIPAGNSVVRTPNNTLNASQAKPEAPRIERKNESARAVETLR